MHHRRRLVGSALAAGFSSLAAVLTFASCAQEPIEAEVRSLERSGRVSFVCLGAPGAAPGRPTADCLSGAAESPNDFSVPHLYALVTQTTRGEVAVIDLTTETDSVLDQDPVVPGANFLPIGAQPIDIVSTPNGTATFVSVAEIGRQGIFALPSSDARTRNGARVRGIRPISGVEANTLSDWPACALPAAPGNMLVVADPPNAAGDVRATCDGEYGPAPPPANDAGDLGAEGQGRLKLVVALPDEGALAIIDAQKVLEAEPGSFAPCPIERVIPLRVDWVPSVPAPVPPGPACVVPPDPVGPDPVELRSRPAGLAFEDGRLYVADLEAPVIHVLDMPSACDPVERPSLLPRSADDPSRIVTTSRVAVSPGLTPEGKRFLYAIDADDGSTMVFDVSDDAPSVTPLEREHPERNPFSPRDRIKFSAPARDVVIVERDRPAQHPVTGVAPTGVRCDPDPSLEPCTGVADCDIETLYRTSATYDSGAGPYTLRGTFAFIVLTSGQVVVIDIDDYDAACRGPREPHPLFGCETTVEEPLVSSGELSCNVVTPHAPRSSVYFLTNDDVGRHQPGVQLFPLLYDETGTLLPIEDESSPRMRATFPAEGSPPEPFRLAVGSNLVDIDQSGVAVVDGTPRHTLAMNFEDPRAHIADQAWTITYEGALPGFDGKRAELVLSGESRTLTDASSRFCDAGVQSRAAVVERFGAGVNADALADRIQITNEITDQDSSYWETPGLGCTYQQCLIDFGSAAVPTERRDIRILEAYQDHVELDVPEGPSKESPEERQAKLKCCFPGTVTFNVRAGGQWVVVGDRSGLLHHVIPDPTTGVCRMSCDPDAALLEGRVRHRPLAEGEKETDPVRDDDPYAFKNPMFRFVIGGGSPIRNYQYRFVTSGAFPVLLVDLAGDSGYAQPQAITPVPATGDLAVTDGSLQGLILVNPGLVEVTRRFF